MDPRKSNKAHNKGNVLTGNTAARHAQTTTGIAAVLIRRLGCSVILPGLYEVLLPCCYCCCTGLAVICRRTAAFVATFAGISVVSITRDAQCDDGVMSSPLPTARRVHVFIATTGTKQTLPRTHTLLVAMAPSRSGYQMPGIPARGEYLQ